MTREVEWDEWQRSLALASLDLENSIDPGTGVPSWDAYDPTAIDPDGEFHWRAEKDVNFAQAAIDRARREDKDGDSDGVRWTVRKIPARTD